MNVAKAHHGQSGEHENSDARAEVAAVNGDQAVSAQRTGRMRRHLGLRRSPGCQPAAQPGARGEQGSGEQQQPGDQQAEHGVAAGEQQQATEQPAAGGIQRRPIHAPPPGHHPRERNLDQMKRILALLAVASIVVGLNRLDRQHHDPLHVPARPLRPQVECPDFGDVIALELEAHG